MTRAQTATMTTALREILAEVDAAMAATGQGACHATRLRLMREAQQRRAAAARPVVLWAREVVA